jgi:predicted GH43/DUF377 family glycosyl hydrolase
MNRDVPGVRHLDLEIRPDPDRVVAKTFLPGQELLTMGVSRADSILARIDAMDEADVERLLGTTTARFSFRHRDLTALLQGRFELVAHRMSDPDSASPARRLLIGACFTLEYAVEAAALFNPSMVEHPDQTGLPAGSRRFVMSVRGVGEGHVSSIEFRTGIVDASGDVVLDDSSGLAELASVLPAVYSKAVLAQRLAASRAEQSNVDYVLEVLPATFGRAELDAAVSRLDDQGLTRGSGLTTRRAIEWIADCNYLTEFSTGTTLDERVIMPRGPSEIHGMEDVRLVRFTDKNGATGYLGTYTAFDGSHVAPQLLSTTDFRTFEMSQLSGPAAIDKGMALFPRPVHGQYLSLSRWDRESTYLTSSGDLHFWETSALLQRPERPWEIMNVGNCGSPIETEAGWLVLTHGVGPMREYSIGAILLDLDDPRLVIGRLSEPLIEPTPNARSGYVPSVVYSCGAMRHGSVLVLPYGCNDVTIQFCVVDLPILLERLTASGRPT